MRFLLAGIQEHPHYSLATSFASLPAEQNPLITRDVRNRYPENLRRAIAEIEANEQLSKIARGAVTVERKPMDHIFRPSFRLPDSMVEHVRQHGIHPDLVQPVAAVAMAQQIRREMRGHTNDPISALDLSDIEHGLMLNPFGVLSRHFRAYLLGGTVAGGIFTASPQRNCIPFRLVSASGLSGTIANLASGVEFYTVGPGAMSSELFDGRNPDIGWLRPILTKVGVQVTATVTGIATGQLALLCFDMSEKGMLSQPLGKLRPMAVQFTVPAAGGNVVVNLQPQKRSRLRRFAIDSVSATAGLLTSAGTFVGPITVQNDPQFESGAQVPWEVFRDRGLALDIDGDVCEVGGLVSFTGTFPAVVGGGTVNAVAYFDTEG